MPWVAACGVLLLLPGCTRRPAGAAPMAHYLIGAPYEAGGHWFYPRESFDYSATGLASVLPDRAGLTADGEAFDRDAMAAAHATLQLPAIALVTNLENGRQVEVRVNDRGPADAGRVIGLTPQAATLLGMGAGGVAPVRVEVESGPSQALRDRLQGGPRGIVAAPVAAVTAEALPAPGGRAGGGSRVAPAIATPAVADDAPAVPDRLPATVRQVPVGAVQLWVEAGAFSRPAYANVVKARLSGLPVEVRNEGRRRALGYVVMVGPFGSVPAADAALDQARAAGVTDAAIVVE